MAKTKRESEKNETNVKAISSRRSDGWFENLLRTSLEYETELKEFGARNDEAVLNVSMEFMWNCRQETAVVK